MRQVNNSNNNRLIWALRIFLAGVSLFFLIRLVVQLAIIDFRSMFYWFIYAGFLGIGIMLAFFAVLFMFLLTFLQSISKNRFRDKLLTLTKVLHYILTGGLIFYFLLIVQNSDLNYLTEKDNDFLNIPIFVYLLLLILYQIAFYVFLKKIPDRREFNSIQNKNLNEFIEKTEADDYEIIGDLKNRK